MPPQLCRNSTDFEGLGFLPLRSDLSKRGGSTRDSGRARLHGGAPKRDIDTDGRQREEIKSTREIKN